MPAESNSPQPVPDSLWSVALPDAPPVPQSVMLTLVCRGCCCGTGKHPDVDHERHLQELEATGVALEVTGCMGPCRLSNVVVAVAEDGQQTWFGRVLDDRDLADVASWVGDPGRRNRPDHLLQRPSVPQRGRAELVVQAWKARRSRRRFDI